MSRWDLPDDPREMALLHALLLREFAPQVKDPELKPIAALLGDRDDAIRSGVHLDGVRHEVGNAVIALLMSLHSRTTCANPYPIEAPLH